MPEITKGIKLRCYPNEAQRNQLPQLFGNNRKVWNELLAMQQELYKKNKGTDEKTYYSQYDMSGILTKMKKDDNFAYLKYSDSTALQTVCEDLHKAYQALFRHIRRAPRFKNKYAKQSYTSKATNSSPIKQTGNHYIKMRKLGSIKTQPYNIKGRVIRATISQTPSGKYFISLTIKQNVVEKPKTTRSIGIDLGLRNIAILSNGVKYKALHFKELDRQIALWQRKYQRRLDNANETYLRDMKDIREKRGGLPFTKDEELYRNLEPRDRRGVKDARKRIAKLHEKKANKRKDYLQKLSTKIVNQYDTIVVEKLNVKGMLRNHSSSKGISDQGWSMFVDMLQYKAKWYGKELIKVNPANTTQTCSICGYVSQGDTHIGRDVEEWNCPSCGAHHDRDTNAARNILTLGLNKKNKKKNHG